MALIEPSQVGIDPYGFAQAHLSEAALAALQGLRQTLVRDVLPLVDQAWESATMPPGVLQSLVSLELMQPPGVDEAEANSSIFCGFRNFVLAAADVSVATMYNAQAGLFRSTVRNGGSKEQAAELDPLIRTFSYTGVFALTEPEHGSDIARGLGTVASRQGDHWTIDGAKRWIGGASTADVLAVFARDIGDGEVKAFLVPRGAAGVTLSKIEGKIALRPMQNADIALDGVRVPESARLQSVNSWRDVAHLLRLMRSDVAWIAAGLQAGALEAAIRYVTHRQQFGKPIAGFQLIQEKLARMLGNTVSSLAMVVQLSLEHDAGRVADHNSALAKMQTSLLARETVALAREVVGGNGILLETGVARFFADAEAVYSYEGTHEINSLIVGSALTGLSAFV